MNSCTICMKENLDINNIYNTCNNKTKLIFANIVIATVQISLVLKYG